MAAPFLTSALAGGVSFASLKLYPRGKERRELIVYETAWTLNPVWTLWRRKNNLALPRIKLRRLFLSVQYTTKEHVPVLLCKSEQALLEIIL
jgi:hypothetical protein